MKVGVIGAGNRFFNVYEEILDSLGAEVYLWNRTKSKVKNLFVKDNYVHVENLKDFESLGLDVCLAFLPPELSYDILSSLDFSYPLLIETPVLDQRWAYKNNVGVLEQWIYLPTEQLKELIYESGLIRRPYWVFNDGRSFEYHAIAQLRKYCGNAYPKNLMGKRHNAENDMGFIDKTGKKNHNINDWVHGMASLISTSPTGGTTEHHLTYSFTYNCKMTTLKPYQLLRAYSSDGSIVSGRSHEMDNDYELFEIRYCDEKRNVLKKKVERKREDDTTVSLKIPGKIEWINKFASLNFNDQQTAIAYMIEAATKGEMYASREGFIDFCIMSGINQSDQSQQVLKFQ